MTVHHPSQLAELIDGSPPGAGTVYGLLVAQTRRDAAAVALCAPGRAPLSYGQLLSTVDALAAALHQCGVRPKDRVALVLPEGPELAVAFLGTSTAATCAILNPAYRARELALYLDALRINFVVLQADAASAAREVARERGLAILELVGDPRGAAGSLSLLGAPRHEHRPAPEPPASGSVMLLLPTSGTTARPKIVPLSHGNIQAAAVAMAQVLLLGPADRCLNIMPFFHIHGLSTLTASIAAGASVVCTSGFDPLHYFSWVAAHQPTWTTASPAFYQTLSDLSPSGPAPAGSFRFLRSASAAMPTALIAKMEQLFGAPFIEAYGMTEAGPLIASNPLPPQPRKLGSVGRAAGTELAVANEHGQLLPAGQRGEIVVRGPNVIRHYDGDTETSAAAFTQGSLRTGDQGYVDADGFLFLTGRCHEIINRGGEKVSPAEVEAALLEHAAVADAVTFAVAHPRLGEEVAAAIVRRPDQPASQRELQHHVARRLADFKVPRFLWFVAQLPRSPTGKLARSGLVERLGLQVTPVLADRLTVTRPRTPTEELLAEVWAGLLAIAPHWLCIHDNLFQLGADSLLALHAIPKIAKAVGVTLRVADFFLNPTLAELARRVEDTRRTGQGGPATASSPRPPEQPSPLSFAEEGLWFLDQLEPHNAAYNVYRGAHLTGAIEPAILEQALCTLVQRHDALASSYKTTAGRPGREHSDSLRVPLVVVELRSIDPPKRRAEAERLAQAEARRPFDLDQAPLLRTSLLRLDDQDCLLLVVAHHIVIDLWSLGVFFTELDQVYDALLTGSASPLPALPIRYADFAAWQRNQEALFSRQLAYWKEQLADLPPPLFVANAPLSGAAPATAGDRIYFQIPQELSQAAKALSRREEVTLFLTLLAVLDILLCRATGQKDLVVGSPVAGRQKVEVEGLVGMFSSTLVLRTKLAGAVTFLHVLARVRETALAAYAHQELPFERLVQAVAPSPGGDRTPLFQVNFRVQQDAAPRHLGRHARLRFIKLSNQRAKFPLAVELADTAAGLHGFVDYQSAFFTPGSIHRLIADFIKLLAQVVENPGRELLGAPLGVERAGSQVGVSARKVPAFRRQAVPLTSDGSNESDGSEAR